MHLLVVANHKPSKWKAIEINRGQRLTGRQALALETGLSEQEIRTALNKLKSTGELTINPTNKFSLITVCNYEEYQECEDDNQPTVQPTVQPASNQRSTTNKNVKNVRSKEKEYCAEPQTDNSAPPIMTFPLSRKGEEFNVTQADVDQWQDSFPGVDVLVELKACRQWNIDNPSKRKTKTGIRGHISRWLGKAQNSGKGRVSAPSQQKNKCQTCNYEKMEACHKTEELRKTCTAWVEAV